MKKQPIPTEKPNSLPVYFDPIFEPMRKRRKSTFTINPIYKEALERSIKRGNK